MNPPLPPSPFDMCHDRVLGERIAVKPKGLIHIPDTVKDDARYKVVVVAVGPGRTTDFGIVQSPPCKVGDEIAFIPSAGIPFTLFGHTYIALDSSQIIGVIKPEVVEQFEKDAELANSRISG